MRSFWWTIHSGTTRSSSPRLGNRLHRSSREPGYGGKQNTCYTEALRRGPDIVIMLHSEYQCTPKLIGAMAWLVASEEYNVILGSRNPRHRHPERRDAVLRFEPEARPLETADISGCVVPAGA